MTTGIRSGLSGQIGWATEETVGTYKAPATYGLVESESLARTNAYIESHGLAAGRMFQRQNLHIATTRDVAGDFTLELLESGFGKLFNLLHGKTVTPSKTETKTYTQKHEIGTSDPYGKALTIQVGRTDPASGTVEPFSYVGCKILGMTLSVAAGGTMMLTCTVNGMDEKTSEALGSASYSATALPFSFENIEAKIAGSKVAYVKAMTINIAVPQATDRYMLGGSGIKSEPIANDLASVTVDCEMEFNKASHERFTAGTVVELALNGKGQKIEGTNYCEAKFAIKAAKQISSGPVLTGPEIVQQSASFQVLDNGSVAPLIVELVNEDSAI